MAEETLSAAFANAKQACQRIGIAWTSVTGEPSGEHVSSISDLSEPRHKASGHKKKDTSWNHCVSAGF